MGDKGLRVLGLGFKCKCLKDLRAQGFGVRGVCGFKRSGVLRPKLQKVSGFQGLSHAIRGLGFRGLQHVELKKLPESSIGTAGICSRRASNSTNNLKPEALDLYILYPKILNPKPWG